MLIENTQQAYIEQNRLREAAGLPPRTPPGHNLLIEEQPFLAAVRGEGLDLLEVEEFAGLPDLLLYILGPMVNGGDIDYENPMVSAATELLLECPDAGAVRGCGQNRLFRFRKSMPPLPPQCQT